MYPKTGQRGADVTQTAMLRALSLNVSPTAGGVCWRGWMWAVSDSLQDPSACQHARWGRPCQLTQVPAVASHHGDLRLNPELTWLGWEFSMFCLRPSIFSLFLFLSYHFQLCRSFLNFPPFCYSVNVWAWTKLETPFRYCFHLSAPYVYFESKGSPASESLCCFLILQDKREGHQGRLWLLFCLVSGTPVEGSIITLYLIVCVKHI